MNFNRAKTYFGDVLPEEYQYIDGYFGKEVAVFLPNGGVVECIHKEHSHPAYFFIILSHDRQYIKRENKSIIVQPDRMLAVSPNTPYSAIPVDIQSHFCAIAFEKDYFEKLVKQHDLEIPKAGIGLFEKDEFLLTYIGEFIEEVKRTKHDISFAAQELENLIANKIVRAIESEPVPLMEYTIDANIKVVIEYLLQHYNEKIILEDMVKMTDMCLSRFCEVFKREVGKTPVEFLSEIRMDKAKQMVVFGGDKMSVIAQKCGYNSPSNFSSHFKKKFGFTPDSYRRMFQIK